MSKESMAIAYAVRRRAMKKGSLPSSKMESDEEPIKMPSMKKDPKMLAKAIMMKKMAKGGMVESEENESDDDSFLSEGMPDQHFDEMEETYPSDDTEHEIFPEGHDDEMSDVEKRKSIISKIMMKRK